MRIKFLEGNISFFHQHLYRELTYILSLENKLNFYLQQLLCTVTNTIFNLLFLLSTLTICFLHQRATTHPNPTINIFYYSFFSHNFFNCVCIQIIGKQIGKIKRELKNTIHSQSNMYIHKFVTKINTLFCNCVSNIVLF